MFKKILVPVDLAHIEAIQRALSTSADLARHYGAEVCYMAVTTSTPGTVARTPEEYEHKLEAFASGQEAVHGQKTSSRCINSPDPTADLDRLILKSIEAVGADLVVMATHLPRHLDAVMPSHGDRIASHTDVSVFLVRPA
ncbi:universal stress protein [Spiribacter sp. 1M153]|uniref:universal stress protein n=1 Tax=Spiribacter roseus TaxID=1855875 RepID=UPI00349FCFC4